MRAFLLLALFFAAAPARAQVGSSGGRVYDVQLEVDLGVTLASAVFATSFALRGVTAPAHCAPLCDRGGLWTIDRWAAGRYEPEWRLVSDAGFAVAVVGALGAGAWAEEIDDGLSDALVVLETIAVTSGLNVLATHAIGRPRPYVYGERAPEHVRLGGDSRLAFPSGHTANAFAAITAGWRTLNRRYPRSPWPWVFLAVGGVVATTVGVSRVIVGDHFPTDVLAGALEGVGIGLLVPALHLRRGSTSLGMVTDTHGAGLVVRGAF